MTQQLSSRLRWQLSLLWALEWGVSGAVLTYLPLYLTGQGINEQQLGMLMAVSAVGLWVAPFVVGQICDRWMAMERYLAISHLVGAAALVSIPVAVDRFDPESGENFLPLLILLGGYACAYLPTVPLASALTFRHLPDPDRQFGGIRVWGTVGWVGAGWLLSIWLGQVSAYQVIDQTFAGEETVRGTLETVRLALGWMRGPESADSFRLAAMLSLLLSSFCLFLPRTPPPAPEESSIAPLVVLKMFANRTFLVLIATSFVLATIVPFYALAVPHLLSVRGVSSAWVPAVMTAGQLSEFPSLILLHVLLKRMGMKRTFALGIIAWIFRYLIFAIDGPVWLIVAGISLHGVCHVFLIIVVQLYVDQACPRDTRASAQNLFGFITLGIAMPAGFLLSGALGQYCRISDAADARYGIFFGLPAVLLCAVLWAFNRFFQIDSAASAQERSTPR